MDPKIDMKQIYDFVLNEKPIGIETSQRWLKHLVQEREYLLSQLAEERGVAM